jgi:ADP-ribosylglycohydrolase
MGQKNSLPTNQKARNCILGAMIGDSIGSTLEFTNAEHAKQILIKYNNFNYGLIGKGPHNLIPGQFTDDTELALAIMQVIFDNGEYNQKLVAKAYHRWYNSKPFDIGKATSNALKNQSASTMISVAKTLNINSMSNGFLMRLFGLVGLYHGQSYEKLMIAIEKDVVLTHGHPEALIIAKFYGSILLAAVQSDTVTDIYHYGKTFTDQSELISNLYLAVKTNNDYFVYNNQKYDMEDICGKYQGFVGFALWLLLKCLKQYDNYPDAIIYTLSFGGDTDTNACIVGAVMGALYPTTIPQTWIDNLCNCTALERYVNYPIANPKVWMNWLP